MAKLAFRGPTVSLQEVADGFGGLVENVEYFGRKMGLEFVVDQDGNRVLRFPDAVKLVEVARAAIDEHSDRWNGYQVWLRTKREAEAKEREAIAMVEAQERAKIADERRRREAEDAALERQRTAEEAEAARAASGLTFQHFLRERQTP